ncbi:MAG: condensation domain-containing protein [Pirellulaceae bacterium]|jgi:hypothetical protein|nr:condensation domain-containing protein [Pirellulaceae bacterium]MDP7019475.1 condensation domain-containing protein [Pirellulaceae bacterium]
MTRAAPRRLSPFEHAIWRLSEAATFNFAIISRVRGPLTEDTLNASLRLVQARHPLLQLRVETADEEPWFQTNDVPPPVLHCTRQSDGDWTSQAAEQINQPISSETGPLVRCQLIRHADDQHDIILTIHHLIGDGMSGVYLMRDLLRAANQLAAGDSPETLEPLADMTPIDQRMPENSRGMSGAWRHWNLVGRTLFDDLRWGAAARLQPHGEPSLESRRVLLVPKQFDEGFSTALRDRARAAGATVHSALSAAILLATADHIDPAKRVSVKHRTPMNVREQLAPPAGEDVGMFASMLFYRGRCAGGDDFWALARAVREQLVRKMKADQALVNIRIAAWLYRAIGGDRLTHQQLIEQWRKRARTTTALTNLGQLKLEWPEDPLRVETIRFVASPGPLGDSTCTALSFQGQLYCNFIFVAPTFQRESAERLSMSIVERLEAATNQNS